MGKPRAEGFQPDKADPEASKSIQLLCKWKQANKQNFEEKKTKILTWSYT